MKVYFVKISKGSKKGQLFVVIPREMHFLKRQERQEYRLSKYDYK